VKFVVNHSFNSNSGNLKKWRISKNSKIKATTTKTITTSTPTSTKITPTA
jgi:hypothetical protein